MSFLNNRCDRSFHIAGCISTLFCLHNGRLHITVQHNRWTFRRSSTSTDAISETNRLQSHRQRDSKTAFQNIVIHFPFLHSPEQRRNSLLLGSSSTELSISVALSIHGQSSAQLLIGRLKLS